MIQVSICIILFPPPYTPPPPPPPPPPPLYSVMFICDMSSMCINHILLKS